jgi:REP element-mobilizing transposase RayT
MKDFALLLTWTCYGNWLPGDARGYVSNTRNKQGGFEPLQNIPGTPVAVNNRDSRELARNLQQYAAVRLTQVQAALAADSFIATAISRDWIIRRGAVMANHVHLVVMECPNKASDVRRAFKGVSQAQLSRHAGENRRWWTQGGSDRYLNDLNAIEAAILYVAEQQYCLVQIENNQLLKADGGDKPRRSLDV